MSGSLIYEDFTRYSNLLSQSYDKHENIYKLSRDLTRESKKIICTLHRLPGTSTAQQFLLMTEAETLLADLRDGIISDIANLLLGEPLHFFTQAYCGGMEEYLEALQFYSFIQRGSVLDYNETWQFLLRSPGLKIEGLGDTFVSQDSGPLHWYTAAIQGHKGEHVVGSASCRTLCSLREETSTVERTCGNSLASTPATSPSSPADVGAPPATSNLEPHENKMTCLHQSRLQLMPYDVFILGLSDVSGELMRYCIKSVAVGELEQKDRVVHCLRQMKAGYVALGSHVSKHLANKIYVHERNLSKVENVNYDLRLRGSELTPDQLKDDLQRRPAPDEGDECTPLSP